MGSLAEFTVEPPRAGHETKGVADIVVNVFRTAPHRGHDDNLAFLQK